MERGKGQRVGWLLFGFLFSFFFIGRLSGWIYFLILTLESGGSVFGSVTWSAGSLMGRESSAARNCLAKAVSVIVRGVLRLRARD